MYDYKVEFVYSKETKKKWYQAKGALDSWTLAKEMESLLNEYKLKGYEMADISPIQAPVSYTHLTLPTTPYV